MTEKNTSTTMPLVLLIVGVLVLILGFIGSSPALDLLDASMGNVLMVVGAAIIMFGSALRVGAKPNTMILVVMIVVFVIFAGDIYILLALTMDAIILPEMIEPYIGFIFLASGIFATIPSLLPMGTSKPKGKAKGKSRR